MVCWSKIPTLKENTLFSHFEETINMDNIENFLKVLKADHDKLRTIGYVIQKMQFETGTLDARMCTLDCLLTFMRMYDQDPAVSMGILRDKLDTCYDKLRQLYNFEMMVHSMIGDVNKRIDALEDKHPIRNRLCKLLDKFISRSK